jgi:glucose dehydrogenase
MRRLWGISIIFLTPLCLLGQASRESATQPDDGGQWLMAAKDYANRRYSELNQITTQNVQDLRVAWTFGTGVNRGHESAGWMRESQKRLRRAEQFSPATMSEAMPARNSL